MHRRTTRDSSSDQGAATLFVRRMVWLSAKEKPPDGWNPMQFPDQDRIMQVDVAKA